MMMNAEILRDAEQRRFAWRCRRGLLELDIVLQNFVLYQYDALTLDELQVFDALLALPDNEFWALINNTSEMSNATSAKEKARNAMIYKIKTARLNKPQEAE
ncbi:MAG: succinate dehydrogenase assembly factor 2 [Methylotenera sp.]|nr:succinate dehydrogenase assembly factor 2 [Methylotenera sp.]